MWFEETPFTDRIVNMGCDVFRNSLWAI